MAQTERAAAGDDRDRAWLTPEEVADLLNVTLRTIYQWRWKGYGPPFAKFGKHIRARRSDVEAWADAQKSPAA